MSIVDKLRSLKGVKSFIDKHIIISEKNLDIIFRDFAKTSEWKEHFSKPNSKRYKGSNKTYIEDAHLISLNCFKEFKQWFIINKSNYQIK